MRSTISWAVVIAAGFSLYSLAAAPQSDDRPTAAPARTVAGQPAVEEPSKPPAQMPSPESDRPGDRNGDPGRRFGRWPWRNLLAGARNHPTVKAAFRQAILRAKAATVRVLVDGKPAALGAIVEPDGYIASKASLLGAKITCRLPDGRELPAKLLGENEENDLALLKVEARGLQPVSWRRGGAPPVGSWVATVGQQDDPLAIGVVSAEPRPIPGSRRLPSRRGVLGVSLEQADAGPRIHEVIQGSAAQKVGLKFGDLVRRIDDRPIRSVQQMVEIVGSHSPGEKITLLIERGKDELTRTPTLAKSQPNRPWPPAPEDHWGGGPFSERRYGFPSAMPHDSVLRPTDCGGPLADTDGNVVGINIARALRVTSYAIPADIARQVLAELKKNHADSTQRETK